MGGDGKITWWKLHPQKKEASMHAANELIAERKVTHGDFSDNAHYSQALKSIFHSSAAWSLMPDVMKESLDAQALKLSRILSGNYREPDHWRDLAGYSQLVVNSLE